MSTNISTQMTDSGAVNNGESKYTLIVDGDKLQELSDTFDIGIQNFDVKIQEYAGDSKEMFGSGAEAILKQGINTVGGAVNQIASNISAAVTNGAQVGENSGAAAAAAITGEAADVQTENIAAAIQNLVDQKETYKQYKEEIDNALKDFGELLSKSGLAILSMNDSTGNWI